MYGIIPRPLWEKKHKSDQWNRVDLALRLWLIKARDRSILVDTGIGGYHGPKFVDQFAISGGPESMDRALEEAQCSCDGVTDLVLSHLHFDHAGGVARRQGEGLVPTFARATLHLHKGHYDYAVNPTPRDGGSFHSEVFGPVVDFYRRKKKLHWLEGHEGEILSVGDWSLKFLTSCGHTPHLVHPFDQKFIYLADIVPTSHHVHLPWVMAYDMAPGVSTQDKERILSFVQEQGLRVIYEHDPVVWCSQIDRAGPKFVVAQAQQAPLEKAFPVE